VVGAVRARELHAALHARDAVEAFHNLSVVPLRGTERHGSGAAKVMKTDQEGVPNWEVDPVSGS
jgi:hypothetical protein